MTPRSKALFWGAALLCSAKLNRIGSRIRSVWAPSCALALSTLAIVTLLASAPELRLAWIAGASPSRSASVPADPTPEQIAKALSSGTLSVDSSRFDADGSLLISIKAPPSSFAPAADPGKSSSNLFLGDGFDGFHPAELGGWLLLGASLWILAAALGATTLVQGAVSVASARRSGRSGPAAVDSAFNDGAFRGNSPFSKLLRAGALDSYFKFSGAPSAPRFARLRFAIFIPLATVHLFGFCALVLSILFAISNGIVIAAIFAFAPFLHISGQSSWIAKVAPWSPFLWGLIAAPFLPRFLRALLSGAPARAASSAAESAAKARDILLKAGAAKLAAEEEKAVAAEIADAPCKKSPPRSL